MFWRLHDGARGKIGEWVGTLMAEKSGASCPSSLRTPSHSPSPLSLAVLRKLIPYLMTAQDWEARHHHHQRHMQSKLVAASFSGWSSSPFCIKSWHQIPLLKLHNALPTIDGVGRLILSLSFAFSLQNHTCTLKHTFLPNRLRRSRLLDPSRCRGEFRQPL